MMKKFFLERNDAYDVVGMYLVKLDNPQSYDLRGISLHYRTYEYIGEDGGLCFTVIYYACFVEEKEARAWAASVRIDLD